MIPRLGVNIDHVATLRQARGEEYPSLVDAAKVCLENGADQITIHLREDRRHIQDTDVGAVQLVTKKFGKPLNLEMGSDPEIVEIAKATAPEWVCIVPEKREEVTTEGGLNLKDKNVFKRVENAINEIKKASPQTRISLFLEHDLEILRFVADLNVEAVEVHTGDYARDALNGNDCSEHLDGFAKAKEYLDSINVATHAGHGLTDESVRPLLEQGVFEEYNIGHWIICQAVYDGLKNVVQNLKKDFETIGEKK